MLIRSFVKYFLLITPILLVACQPTKTIVLFIDSYSAELWGIELKTVLQSKAAKFGYNISFILNKAGDNYFANLKEALQNTNVDKIIVSPLLTYEVNQLASQYPQKQFLILFAPDFQEILPPNVKLCRENSLDFYFELGKKTALLLDAPELSFLGTKVGIIYFSESNLILRQVTEFERGFSTVLETDHILKKELSNLTDKASALRPVEDLFQQGVKVWLLKVYQLNSTCLERISDLDGYFIIEDFSYFKAFADNLFLAIEPDYEKLLEDFLNSQSEKYYSTLELKLKIVPGPLLTDEKFKKILE